MNILKADEFSKLLLKEMDFRIGEDIQKAYEVKKLILLALWAKGWSLVMYLTIFDKDKIRSSGTPKNSTSE